VPYLKAGFDKFEKFKTESDEVKDDSDKSKIIEIFENHFNGKVIVNALVVK